MWDEGQEGLMVLHGFGGLEEDRLEAGNVAGGTACLVSPTSLPRVFLVSCLPCFAHGCLLTSRASFGPLVFPALLYLFLLLPLIFVRLCDGSGAKGIRELSALRPHRPSGFRGNLPLVSCPREEWAVTVHVVLGGRGQNGLDLCLLLPS